MHKTLLANSLTLVGCLALGCGGSTATNESTAPAQSAAAPAQVQVSHAEFAPQADKKAKAVAKIEKVGRGNQEVGSLTFEQKGDRVMIRGELSNLPPGARGIQIRENGDCSGKRARRAGSHYNPTDTRHGPPEAARRHVGDLGNIEVAKDGSAQFQMVTDSLTVVEGGPSTVLDRSIVITARKDDGKSQPDGNAGPPIACGVIRSE